LRAAVVSAEGDPAARERSERSEEARGFFFARAAGAAPKIPEKNHGGLAAAVVYQPYL
jgi:hypothetical protein